MKLRVFFSSQFWTLPFGQTWTPSLWAWKIHGGCVLSLPRYIPSWRTGTWNTLKECWIFWKPLTDFYQDWWLPSNTWRSYLASRLWYGNERWLHSFKHVKSYMLYFKLYFLLLFIYLPLSLGYFLSVQVIMWMLRVGRGMVDTLFTINKFFPSKLPQYQDQCVSVQHWN